jgi:hypothetical protein
MTQPKNKSKAKAPPAPPPREALSAAVRDIDTALRRFWGLLNAAYPDRPWGGEWARDEVLKEVLPLFHRSTQLSLTWLLVLMGLVKPGELLDGDYSTRVGQFFDELPERYADRFDLWPAKEEKWEG